MWMCNSALGMARKSAGKRSALTVGTLNIDNLQCLPDKKRAAQRRPLLHRAKRGERARAYCLSPPGILPSTPLT